MARIRTIKPESLEAAEFRGFFFGEGHLDLIKQGRTTRGLSPRARIALREDDVGVLRWVMEFLGGNLSYRESTRSYCWQLTGKENITRLLDILCTGFVPSKKRKEVWLMVEAVTHVSVRGAHLMDSSVNALHRIKDELIAARGFYGAN